MRRAIRINSWLPVFALVILGAGCRTTAAPVPPAPAAATLQAALANTIKWSTASEVQNLGFDVYRADAEEGPFSRLTARPILGAGTSDEPHQYRYVDDTIAEGKVYFYYVESISVDGAREKFTPTIRAGAKQRQASPAP